MQGFVQLVLELVPGIEPGDKTLCSVAQFLGLEMDFSLTLGSTEY